MTHTRSGEIVLLVTLLGLTGCRESNQAAPSPIPRPAMPANPAAIGASAISPDRGPTWRQTAVEVLGSGFRANASLTFGGIPAIDVRVVEVGTIWARSALHAAGAVDVIVTNPGGERATLVGGFTYDPVPLPTVTSSPGVVAPGTQFSVSWNTPIAGHYDWIALFRVGSPSEGSALWYRYIDGSTFATVTLNAPSQPGQYEFRYFPDDDHIDVARSAAVTVTQP